jgi:hypothetical protein
MVRGFSYNVYIFKHGLITISQYRNDSITCTREGIKDLYVTISSLRIHESVRAFNLNVRNCVKL